MNQCENDLRCQCGQNTSLNILKEPLKEEVNKISNCEKSAANEAITPEKLGGKCCAIPPPSITPCPPVDPCEKLKTCTTEITPQKIVKCCTISPITPPPCPPIDPCEKKICPPERFCERVKDEFCENYLLTAFGKDFDSQTGHLIKNCLCVKFNGLQDMCKHPGCCTKEGCLDNPFPTCPPAQNWKYNYTCRKLKKKGDC